MYYNTQAINELDMEEVATRVCGYIPGQASGRGLMQMVKVGNRTVINCPEHNDRSPSCSIFHNRYYCFACGAKGNNIDLVMHSLGVDFISACKAISEEFTEYSLTLSKERAKEFEESKNEYADFPLTNDDLFWLGLKDSAWGTVAEGSCESKLDIPEGKMYLGTDPKGYVLYGRKERILSLKELWKTEPEVFNELIFSKCVESIARIENILNNNTCGKIVKKLDLTVGCNDLLNIQLKKLQKLLLNVSGYYEALKQDKKDEVTRITKSYYMYKDALNDPVYAYIPMGEAQPDPELEPYDLYTDIPFLI